MDSDLPALILKLLTPSGHVSVDIELSFELPRTARD
jgi:hypothetical protein